MLIKLIFAHPQFGPNMIQRLSETRPIRRAARFTAYIYLRSKQAVDEGHVGKVDAARFGRTFGAELRKGWQEAREKLAEEQRRGRKKL